MDNIGKALIETWRVEIVKISRDFVKAEADGLSEDVADVARRMEYALSMLDAVQRKFGEGR